MFLNRVSLSAEPEPGAEPGAGAGAITWMPPADARLPDVVRVAVDRLAAEADVVHVHIDLDVHDLSIAPANSYAAPDGLSATDVQRIVGQIADQLPVASVTLAYDSAYDPHRRMRRTALQLFTLLATLGHTAPDPPKS